MVTLMGGSLKDPSIKDSEADVLSEKYSKPYRELNREGSSYYRTIVRSEDTDLLVSVDADSPEQAYHRLARRIKGKIVTDPVLVEEKDYVVTVYEVTEVVVKVKAQSRNKARDLVLAERRRVYDAVGKRIDIARDCHVEIAPASGSVPV